MEMTRQTHKEAVMAKQKRRMPTAKQVLEHWTKNGMYDPPNAANTCWACGFPACVQRAHILAKCDGGTDEVDNLVLLCARCHLTQEYECRCKTGRERFREAIMSGAPYQSQEIDRRFSGLQDTIQRLEHKSKKCSPKNAPFGKDNFEKRILALIKRLLDEGEPMYAIIEHLNACMSDA